MSITSEILLAYLNDILSGKSDAELDIEHIEEDYVQFGKALTYFANCYIQNNIFANALAKGDLSIQPPPQKNKLAAPLKSLQVSLKHLIRQIKQVAKGDYKLRTDFMGEFSEAFNTMVEQLTARHQKFENEIKESKKNAYHDPMTNVFNRFYGMLNLHELIEKKIAFSLVFVDMDNLKFVNDKYGHSEGDKYITNVAEHLCSFSQEAMVCRIGGDEFMLLIPNMNGDKAHERMNEIQSSIKNDEYLETKSYTYSISYGIAAVYENNELPASSILNIADVRMYESKRAKKKYGKDVT